jgi:predicted regulator of Ras-like GTPase activity (Roadblock/LC7/MglB family)
MSLVVEQLIYSSFERLGFKYIASANVPLSIQQIFYQNIVSRLWDSYNPPAKNHKGVYLYQIDRDRTLFGWLANDGYDEFGRADIPYFHCYYLTEPLDSTRLVKILACLENGPIERVARDKPITASGDVVIPDSYRSSAFDLGVKLSKDIRLFSHRQLREGKLLQWYVSAKTTGTLAENPFPSRENFSLARSGAEDLVEHRLPAAGNTSLARHEDNIGDNITEIGHVLLDLMAKPIAIEGVALVSPEGQLLSPSIGIEENSSLILSGTMLYLANNTLEELAWDRVEQIAIRGPRGNVIITACTEEAFLLVKTGKVLSGLLEGEIQKTRAKLQHLLENADLADESPSSVNARLESKAMSAFDTVFYGFESTMETADLDRP